MGNDQINENGFGYSKLEWDLRDEVSDYLDTTRLKKGFPVFNESDEPSKCYLLQNGILGLYRFIKPDKRILLHKILPNETTGVTQLLLEHNYPAHLIPIKESVSYEGTIEDLKQIKHDNPELLNKMILWESHAHSRAYQKIQDILSEDIEQRIARELIDLANHIGRNTDKGLQIVIKLTRKEISRMVGCSKESVSRVMSDWEKNNVIQTDQQQITLSDQRKLQSLIEPQI